MKRQEHTVYSKRYVSPHVLSTDCCADSTNAAVTLPSCNAASRGGEHRKIISRTSFSPKKIKKWWILTLFLAMTVTWPLPPVPLWGVRGTVCGCDFRGVTFDVTCWQLVYKFWLDKLSFVKSFEEGSEARMTSQLDSWQAQLVQFLCQVPLVLKRKCRTVQFFCFFLVPHRQLANCAKVCLFVCLFVSWNKTRKTMSELEKLFFVSFFLWLEDPSQSLYCTRMVSSQLTT